MAQGDGAIPDLNDPNVRMDRTSAMAAMMARRRETAMADMDPDDAAALAAQPLPKGEPGLRTLDVPADDDTDAGDAAAEAERARLAREADEADRAAAAREETTSQLDTQRADAPVEPAAAAPAQRVISSEEAANLRVRTVVFGQERDVPLNDVIAGHQKVAAADVYLETAKQALAEAKAVRSQLDTQRGTESTTPASVAAPSTTSSEADPLDEALDSLFQGDEKRAKDALQKWRGATPASAVDVNALARQVETTLVIRSAVSQFAKDHKAIMQDPTLRQKADEFVVAELQARGFADLAQAPADEIPQILNTAGTRTKEYLARALGVDLTRQQPRVEIDRQADKRRIVEPAAASARANTAEREPATASDKIEQMRAARMPQPVGR